MDKFFGWLCVVIVVFAMVWGVSALHQLSQIDWTTVIR